MPALSPEFGRHLCKRLGAPVSFEPIQFGKYKLVQPLAHGGMAEIFLARQQGPAGFEKTVVIKRVLAHLGNHPDFVTMFLDEARLAAQLSHPNIVQIFDFGEADGSYYLCMEHLRGEDLHTIGRMAVKKGLDIPPQVCATVVSAACTALHYAHSLTSEDGQPLNIVHRDVSPSNLFLTYQGVVKVLDFGIARAEGKVAQTRAGMVKGKLAYMSPEQARGRHLDARSDVFALGIVLHELLTGKRLFWRGNDPDSFKALLEEPIPAPSASKAGIPAELDEICARALQRDVDARYPSAKEMYADLDDFLASRTYVPSQTMLQTWLQDLVGEDVVAEKLKSGSRLSVPKPAGRKATDPRVEQVTASVRRPPKAPPPKRVPSAVEGPSPPVGIIVAAATGAVGILIAIGVLVVERKPPPAPVVVEIVQMAKSEPEAEPAAVVDKPAAPKAGPSRGQLDVNCVPWCAIFIDGKDTGKISPALGIPLSVGKHKLRVVNTPTGVEQEREITIRAGATTREVVKF